MRATDIVIAFLTQPTGAKIQRQRAQLTLHVSDAAELRLWSISVVAGALIMTVIDIMAAVRHRWELWQILWTVARCALRG